MRRASTAVLIALGLTAAPAAHADPKWDEVGVALGVIETAIPDLRVERSVTFDDTRLIYAFPLAVQHGGVGVGGGYALTFTSFVEAQVVHGPGASRGLVGERVHLHALASRTTWMPLVELGGVASADELGGLVGVGLALGLPEETPHIALSPTFAIVVRTTVTDVETRVDVALDVQIPIRLD